MALILNKPTCEQIVDIIPDPFIIIDRQYTIQAANQAYLRRYGVLREEIVGRKCHEISHRSSVPCSQCGEHCPLESVFTSRQPVQVMHVHYRKNGEEDRVQLHGAPIFDQNGEVMYMGEYIYPVAELADDLLVGRSSALLRTMNLLQRVAPTHTIVLLLGESGVGKERAAEYLHRHSQRAGGPFVVVDCGALGENLIERELFGHEKGAFTGAVNRKQGLFEAARGGTLFIDEIGELPLALQVKLLRALETSTIRRLGGTDYIHVDVRVIAATNRDLRAMVLTGQFRDDLYYRLSPFPIVVPPLRERKEDIPLLAEHFLARLPHGLRHLPLAQAVITRLMAYDFPGNVRELRNVIERAYLLAGQDRLGPEHLVFEPHPVFEPCHRPGELAATDWSSTAPRAVYRPRRLSDEDILRALQQSNGHRLHAARLLGISERTLYRQIQRLRRHLADVESEQGIPRMPAATASPVSNG